MFNPAMRDGFYKREAVETYIAAANQRPGEFLFDGRRARDWPTRQYGRLISPWIASLGGPVPLWDAFAALNQGYRRLPPHW